MRCDSTGQVLGCFMTYWFAPPKAIWFPNEEFIKRPPSHRVRLSGFGALFNVHAPGLRANRVSLPDESRSQGGWNYDRLSIKYHMHFLTFLSQYYQVDPFRIWGCEFPTISAPLNVRAPGLRAESRSQGGWNYDRLSINPCIHYLLSSFPKSHVTLSFNTVIERRCVNLMLRHTHLSTQSSRGIIR